MNKMFLTYEQSQWLYVVWVDGVANYYTTYAKAKEYYDDCIEAGHDDLMLDCWDTFHKKLRTICYTEKKEN